MKKLPSSINVEQFKRIYKATNRDYHKVAFLLGFGAGMRISEVVNLRKIDIDTENQRIKIIDGKGGKDRIVPLPKGWKDSMLKDIPIKCGVRSLQIAFKRACVKSEVIKEKPDIHFHSLRHSFGSILAKNKVPIHYIKTLMGHSNISVTNVYLQANPDDALKSYEENFLK